jgi:hypothetical protein
VFARNAVPIIEGIARTYVIRRKYQFHAISADNLCRYRRLLDLPA